MLNEIADPVADLDAVNRFTNFDDLTQVLVAQHGIRRHDRATFVHVKIRAADVSGG